VGPSAFSLDGSSDILGAAGTEATIGFSGNRPPQSAHRVKKGPIRPGSLPDAYGIVLVVSMDGTGTIFEKRGVSEVIGGALRRNA
jgi:hypothetical protein